MDNRYILVVGAVVLVLALSTMFNQNPPEKMQLEIVSAINRVESYRVSTEITAKTTGTVQERQVGFSEEVKAVGVTDVASQRMMMNAVVENTLGGSDTLLMYLVGDTIYVKSRGQWSIQKAPSDYGVWEKRYQIKQLSRIINNSQLTVLSKTSGLITFAVEPEREILLAYIREQASSPGYSLNSAVDLTDALKEYEINVSVDSQTMLPMEFRMRTVVERQGLLRTTETLMQTWDYNKRMPVILPDEVSSLQLTSS